jgi:hypothetical protein
MSVSRHLPCLSKPFAFCDSEPFALCHSEGAKRPKNLAQDKLREESRYFVIARGDNTDDLG